MCMSSKLFIQHLQNDRAHYSTHEFKEPANLVHEHELQPLVRELI